MKTFNIYGGSNKVNFDHMTIYKETEKAICFRTVDAMGHYLKEFEIYLWIPRKIVEKNISPTYPNVDTITLPFWFSASFSKIEIKR